jgi:hypothetical protein
MPTMTNYFFNIPKFLILSLLCHCTLGTAQNPSTVVVKKQSSTATGQLTTEGSEYNWLIQPEIDRVLTYKNGYSLIIKNGGCGFVNPKGKIIADPIYESCNGFSEGLAGILLNGKWGFIDTTGKIVISPQFERVTEFGDSLAMAKIDGKCGYINLKGVFVIEPQFEDAYSPFKEVFVSVKKYGLWGFINKTGKMIIAPRWSSPTEFYKGLAFTEFGHIDTMGKMFVESETAFEIGFINNGFIQTKPKGKYGFLNMAGKLVIPAIYDDADGFREGYCKVKNKNKWGIIDTLNNFILPIEYDEVASFSDNLSLIKKEGKYGYANRQGNIVIPLKYTYAQSFREGLATVMLPNGKLVIIDTRDNIVLSPNQLYDAQPFVDGLSKVNIAGKLGLMDKTGKIILEPQFELIYPFNQGIARVASIRKLRYGFASRNGKILISPQFEYAEDMNEGIAPVQVEGGKWGFIELLNK